MCSLLCHCTVWVVCIGVRGLRVSKRQTPADTRQKCFVTPADAGHGRCPRQVCAVADRSMSNLFAGHDSPTGAAGRNAEGPENAAPAVAGSCSRSGTDGCARACRRRALRHEARAPRRTNQPPRPTAVGCAPRAIGCVSSAKSPAQDCPQTAVRCDGAGRSPDADWVGPVLPAPPFPPRRRAWQRALWAQPQPRPPGGGTRAGIPVQPVSGDLLFFSSECCSSVPVSRLVPVKPVDPWPAGNRPTAVGYWPIIV